MNNSDKVYPQVDDIPDNIKKEWLNNAPQSYCNLTLSDDQFDVLYDVLEETIANISDNIEDTDLELNDYEIYKVFQQMNRFREGKI